MKIDQGISALRGDQAAQSALRLAVAEAVEDCRRQPGMASLLAALEDYGAGAALIDCPSLARLFRGGDAARSVIQPFVARLVELHGDFPLAQLAFRHQSGEGFHFLQIAAKGRATLGLALHDAQARTQAKSVATFPDAERFEAVLAGEADAGLLGIVRETKQGAEIDEAPLALRAGGCLALMGANRSRILREVRGRLLVLRLARTSEAPQPTRQFMLPSGKLVHRASGDRRESRHEMMLALLGRLGRIDAAPLMAALALQRATASDHFRWHALRECLALDTGQGFRSLLAICANRSDRLAPQAMALHADLVATYPALARMEQAACPA